MNADLNVLTEQTFQASRLKSLVMVIVGAILWGVSGTAAQVLFQHDAFTPALLTSLRMLVAGIVLTGVSTWRTGFRHTMNIWRSRRDAGKLVIFAIVGLYSVQYTYFAAIAKGNAAIATFLQYLAPVILAAYFAASHRKLPRSVELAAIVLAVTGTGLLLRIGSTGNGLNGLAVFWGLLSAFALAFYSAYPGRLISAYGPATVTGWAMLVGGLFSLLFDRQVILSHPRWNFTSVSLVVVVVVFGTVIAFYLYLSSLRALTATESSLASCAEPLAAALLATLLLHVHLTPLQLAGGLCIVLTVALLAIRAT